ncbi:Alpha/Beta hydrolase protein [Paraphysoderma sedebokerense]|nr:Alpha/Beta hydrolase protein [Paraphysoderma sedebokerense]
MSNFWLIKSSAHTLLLLLIIIIYVSGAPANANISEHETQALYKRGNKLAPLEIPDPYFIKKAKLIAVASSMSNCPRVDLQSWRNCSRCREYTRQTLRFQGRTHQPAQGERSPGLELIAHINMQGAPIFNGGAVFLQHPVPSTSKLGQSHPLDSTIIISFPGSSEEKDWKDNRRFWKVPFVYNNQKWPGLRIYKGLFQGFLKVWDQVKSIMKTLHEKYPRYNILVTGHSRGAPLAVLAAFYMILEMGIPSELIEAWSFGSPRFVNKEFIEVLREMNVKVWNVQYEGDPIVRLPPSFYGFRHIPRQIFITHRDLLPNGKLSALQSEEDPPRTYLCDPLDGDDRRCTWGSPWWNVRRDRHINFAGWGPGGWDLYWGNGRYTCEDTDNGPLMRDGEVL